MKKQFTFHILILIIISLITFSCNPLEKTSGIKSVKSKKITGGYKINDINYTFPDSEYPTYINNSFSSMPFKIIPTKRIVQDIYGRRISIKEEIVKNKHTELSDTIIICKGKKDFFQFYRTQNRSYIQYTVIQSKKIKLNNNIFIGISKGEIKKQLSGLPEIIPDIIDLTNEERSDYVRLYFKKNNLTKMVWVPYLD